MTTLTAAAATAKVKRMPSARRPIAIRAARARDVPALSLLWAELMELHAGRDPRFALALDAPAQWRTQVSDVLGREDAFVLMAEADGQPVGFCVGWIAKNPPIYRVADVGFISEIAVTGAEQRRGVGRALMDGAGEWFRRRGLAEVQLSTAVWNESAHAFWKAMGGEPLLMRYRFVLHGGARAAGDAGDEHSS